MIKKAFIAAIIFFALHALFVRFIPISNSQNQWQENIVMAQRFIYSKDSIQNIIVGSSLSNRLIIDSLPNFYNFSLQGQSIYDGLYVVSKSNIPPRKIFLEMNMILRKENKSFISSLYSPILYYVRRILPSLRDEYQPVGQISKMMINLLTKMKPNTTLLQKPAVQSDVFKKMLDHEIDMYSTLPDEKILDDRFSIIKKYVADFQKKGTQVIFFEMPVNENLCDLPAAKIIREHFFKTFPIDKYNYLPYTGCKGYKTRDGEHLGPEEALQYTQYFKSQIKNFN